MHFTTFLDFRNRQKWPKISQKLAKNLFLFSSGTFSNVFGLEQWSKVTVLVDDSDDSDDPSLGQSCCFLPTARHRFEWNINEWMTMKKRQKLLLNPKILQISCLRWMQREREREKRKYRKTTEKLTEFFSDVRFQKLSINFWNNWQLFGNYR